MTDRERLIEQVREAEKLATALGAWAVTAMTSEDAKYWAMKAWHHALTALALRDMLELTPRALTMLDHVEWVRQAGGKKYGCPFCGGISERDGGPGHQMDCEGEMVRREGNELRI